MSNSARSTASKLANLVKDFPKLRPTERMPSPVEVLLSEASVTIACRGIESFGVQGKQVAWTCSKVLNDVVERRAKSRTGFDKLFAVSLPRSRALIRLPIQISTITH